MTTETKPVGSGTDELERIDLPITGMTCAACAARIEKSLGRSEGVSEATVNLASERATVRFNPSVTDVEKIVGTIRDTGYDAIVPGPKANESATADLVAEVRREEHDRLREVLRDFLGSL